MTDSKRIALNVAATYGRSMLVYFAIWYVLFALDHFAAFGHHLPGESKYCVHLFVQPVCHAGLLVAVMLLLGRWRWVLLPLYVYVVFVELLEFGLLLAFGEFMTGDLFLIVMNSSWPEVRSFFLEVMPLWVYVVVLMVLSLAGWCAKLLFFGSCVLPWGRKRWTCAALWAILFVAYDLCLLPPRLIPERLFFVNLVRDTLVSAAENAELYAVCRNPEPFGEVRLDCATNHAPLGVFVIGESLTRNSMSIYGYARDTTPCMRRLQGGRFFVFTDLLGAWFNTQGALVHLLTERELVGDKSPRCAFPEVCRQAGYRCALLSNQGRWGLYDTLDTMIFSACEDATWLRETGGGDDIDMLPRLEEMAKGMIYGPHLVFLHLNGSHWKPTSYPKRFKRFALDSREMCPPELNAAQRELYNHYDNSVVQTDAVVAGVIDLLKELKRPSFVIFVSDHGETPRSGNMRQMADKDLWEIPMIVWVSDEYAQAYPEIVRRLKVSVDKPLQQDQLFVGLLSVARVIGYSRYSPARDFLSPEFNPRPVRRIRNDIISDDGTDTW